MEVLYEVLLWKRNNGESVKIQTADGSVFVYKMDEIEKKTKEAPIAQQTSVGTSSYGQNVIEKKSNALSSGYRAFINLGGGVGVGDYGLEKLDFSTVHGYQINPNWFAGIGFGWQIMDFDFLHCPLFAEGRYDIMEGNFSPFVGLRLGVAFDEGGSYFYYAPSLGLRVANRLNLSFAYDASSVRVYNYWSDDEDVVNCGALMFRIGVDLGARK